MYGQMPLIRIPIINQRWSIGFIILLSTMVGIFAFVFGVLVHSVTESTISSTHWPSTPGTVNRGSSPHDSHLQHGLSLYHQGDLEAAASQFALCKDQLPLCAYSTVELGAARSHFDSDWLTQLRRSASTDGNPDSQYLLAALLSNRFTNLTEYTSKTFPESVLYMYAASTAAHHGALLAMGYRHLKGYGVPQRCETAALNYLEVAKPVANIYANSIPKAVELIRLTVEKDRKVMSLSEISLFTEVAITNPALALAVGKRFLLGTDGFPQDFHSAFKFFTIARQGGGGAAAAALLGYMHALGLGVPADSVMAESLFTEGLEDGLGLNGMGYLKFNQNAFAESFGLFNKSAAAGSADGMFNLASMHLTGTGTGQNFQKAFMWFTEALRRGHTPAGYALAVMHLNGLGTVRDCVMAVNLFKEVAERGEYVSSTLSLAHKLLAQDDKELAGVMLLKLAEAGHQVSQENLAHLVDSGQVGTDLFGIDSHEKRTIVAQRFFELAAGQASVASELRLGDMAYAGEGMEADLREVGDEVTVVHSGKKINYLEAIERYKTARENGARIAELMGAGAPAWLPRLVGTAEFNVGYMYHFGIGVRRNLVEAGNHYRRSIPAASHGADFFKWVVNTFVAPEYVDEDDELNVVPSPAAKTGSVPAKQVTPTAASAATPAPPPPLPVSKTGAAKWLRDFRLILVMLLVWVLIILLYFKVR